MSSWASQCSSLSASPSWACECALGLPPAHTQLEGVLLEELQTKAIAAAERVLDECIGDRVSAAYERATAADAAAAASKTSMRGLAALS